MRKFYLFISALALFLGVGHTAMAEDVTVNVNMSTGTLTASGNYARIWTHTETGLTFGVRGGANNITVAESTGEVIQINSGSGGCTYDITAPSGYVVVSYRFDAQSKSAEHTITANGNSYTVGTADKVAVSQADVNNKTASFVLSTPNNGVNLTGFTVTLTTVSVAYEAAANVYSENKSRTYPSSDGTTLGYNAEKVTAFYTALANLGTLLQNVNTDDAVLTNAASAVTNAIVTEADYVSSPTDFTNKIAKVGDAITDASGIVAGNWYTLYNGRDGGGYWTDTNPKVVGSQVKMSNGKGVIGDLTTAMEAAPYLVRFIATGTTGVYHLQFATGNFSGSVGTGNTALVTATEANATDLHVYATGTSTFAINEWTGSDGRKVDNNGSGNTVAYYGSGTNSNTSGNNIWTIYPVTLSEDFLTPYNTAKSEYQTMVTEWNNIAHASNLFYPNTDKVAAMQSLLNTTADPTSFDESNQKLAAFAEAITLEKVVNLPADGNYFFVNAYYTNYTMSAATEHNTIVVSTRPERAVWVVEANAEGKYSIKNYATGEYLQQPSSGQQVKASSTPYYFVMIPAPQEDWGKVSFGADAVLGNQNKLHEDAYEKVVGWDATAKSTHWTMERVDDTALSNAATAEAELATSETAIVRKTADALGVSYNTTITSLKDYIDGLNYAPVYTAAQSKIYRFVKTAGGTSLGLKAGTSVTPAAVNTNPKDLGQLWRMVYVEGSDDNKGVKLVNLNAFAANEGVCAIAALINADVDNDSDASFTSVNYGALFQIADANEAGNFRIENNGNKMNVEGNGIINYWNSSYNTHRFTAVVVEDVEIDLNHVAGKGSYASAYLPFAVSNVEGAKAYVGGAVADNKMPLTEATEGVAAEQGIILIGEDAADQVATLTIGEGSAESSLSGTTVAKGVPAGGVLTLGKSGEEVGLWNFTGETLRANSAYLPKSSETRGLAFSFDNSTTGVDFIETAAEQSGKLYDLSGRRIQKAQKGIYILNGKKYIK